MIVAEFDAASLAKVRIAPSPVLETVTWLRRLTGVDRGHPLLSSDPVAVARAAAHSDVAVTAAMLAGAEGARYVPDFLLPSPPPSGSSDVMGAQIAQIARADRDAVRTQIELMRSLGGAVGNDLLDAACKGTLALRVARGLQVFWALVVRRVWPILERAYAADAVYRSTVMSSGGLGTLFSSLHPELNWNHSCLLVPLAAEERLSVLAREVVLVPSVLQWPRYTVQLCGQDVAINYPIAMSGGREPASGTNLLGSGRSAVLRATMRPCCTAEISAELDLSASTMSYHLQALLRARLVDRRRSGRRVVYVQTARGRELAESISS